MTTAYPAATTDPRSANHGTPVALPQLIVEHVPATPAEGLGPCSECPEHGSIADGVLLVGYHSATLQIKVTEAVCLACLPALTAMLQDSGVDQVTVEIPTPCYKVKTQTVDRLHYERDVLIRRLVVERVRHNVIWAQQRFACTQQMLWRIARGDFDPFAGVSVFVPDTEPW